MTLFQSHPVQVQLKETAHYIRDTSHTDTETYTEIANFIDTGKIGHQ